MNIFGDKTGNKKQSSLKRKMVFYFLLVAFANVFVGLEVLREIRSKDYREKVTAEIVKIRDGQAPVERIYQLLDHLTNKFVIMVIILITVSAVVLFLFVVQIASPIQYMIDKARKIAAGDLSETIEIKSADELADLGNLINDLTANLQEIIAQLEQVYKGYNNILQDYNSRISDYPEIKSRFHADHSKLMDVRDELRLVKDSFTLFRIQQFEMDERLPSAKLGQLLIKDGLITEIQLNEALEHQKIKGAVLGAVLMELGYIDSNTLFEYMEKQRNLESNSNIPVL